MTSNYKNSMYPRSFLCEEAKIKQRTPLKKVVCEIGEKAIWESRFTSFFFTNSCEPELAHRLQTSKMRRNSTSLDSCQHDDVNMVTVGVARWYWTSSLKSQTTCVKNLRSSKTLYAQWRLFYTQGPLFCSLGPFFCALAREEAIFAVCKRCANEVLHATVKK